MSVLRYIPFILLFAAATALIYGWGLWRSHRQQQDLSNLLAAKGVARIKRALKKNSRMTRKELEEAVKGLTTSQPFSKERIAVTNPRQFLDSVIPYMIRQHLISEVRENNKVYYILRK